MYTTPSRRKKKNVDPRLNLIPILDAVFIFIFFLLMSANFIKIYEIPSNVPIISYQEPPPNKKPLALTLKISEKSLLVYSGIPSRLLRSFAKNEDGDYDLESLHQFLVKMKKRFKRENTIVIEPLIDLTYEKLVFIMDAVRILRRTDAEIFRKQDGVQVKVKALFSNIIFGNIQS